MFKVLIIDDEYMIREGLKQTIDWHSIDCEIVGEAEDGDEGLSLIHSLKPDIIFSDIRMPGLNGLEMIVEIKKHRPSCRIIILTGFRNFEYAQEAVKLGVFRFIVKPSKQEDILLAVKEAIDELKEQKKTEKLISNIKQKAAEYFVNENEAISGTEEKGKSSYLVNKALDYMKENFKTNISLQLVADYLYISTWHLSKILKKETGSTFIDLLNSIRVQEAKKLLAMPQYKVYEISELVGFSDTAYFVKLFKKVTGSTPTEYRNNLS